MSCTHHWIHDESIPIVRHKETVTWYGYACKATLKEIQRGYRTFRCCKCGETKEFPMEIYDHETKSGRQYRFKKQERFNQAQANSESR